MEQRKNPRETLETSKSEAVLRVVETMRQLTADPESSDRVERDPVSRAMYAAILEEPIDSPLATAILEMAPRRLRNFDEVPSHGRFKFRNKQSKREEGVTSELVGVIRGSITTFVKDYLPEMNDQDWKTPDAWKPALNALNEALEYDKENQYVQDFCSNMNFRMIATNHPGRHLPIEFLLQALAPRFPNGVNLADYGSSIGAGVNWQIRKMESSQGTILPMAFESVKDRANKKHDVTERANELLQRLPILKHAVEIDLQDAFLPRRGIYSESFKSWVEGSFRARERHDARFMSHFRELVRYKPANVDFFFGDISTEASYEQFKERYPEPRDVVIVGTSLHQNHPVQRQKILKYALDTVHDDGLVIVQEFAYLNPNSRRGPVPLDSIRTRDYWHRSFYYGTYVIDKALRGKDGPGFQEVAKYEDNSRCSKALLMPSRFCVNGDVYPLSDLVANQ